VSRGVAVAPDWRGGTRQVGPSFPLLPPAYRCRWVTIEVPFTLFDAKKNELTIIILLKNYFSFLSKEAKGYPIVCPLRVAIFLQK
jgi:hypothetical protein